MHRGTVPKSWRKGWMDVCSDVNWQDYHGMWAIKGSDGIWSVIRWDNMIDSCGEVEASEAGFIYEACVMHVDFDHERAEDMHDALGFIGAPNEYPQIDGKEEPCELEKVYAWVSYGLADRDTCFTSNTYPERLRAQAKRYIEEGL